MKKKLKNGSKSLSKDVLPKDVLTIRDSGLTCKCCGACCKTIALNASPEQIEADMKKVLVKIEEKGESGVSPNDYSTYFIFNFFEPISRKEAEKINPKMKLWSDSLFFYKCTMQDEATGKCRVYESRPILCREFPFPVAFETAIYSADCAFAEFETEIDESTGKYISSDILKSVSLIIR